MKLVFPILRMNWYRVVASTIEAALAAGHEVECWHGVGGLHYPANRPCRERMPRFRRGQPAVVDFESDEEFFRAAADRRPDAVISISPPWNAGIAARFSGQRPPALWVTLLTNDTLLAATREQVEAMGLIVFRTEHEMNCVCADHENPQTAIVRGGQRIVWDEATFRHLRAHAVRTGYPLLDTALNLDGAAIRSKWGIPADVPVVGCLASPYGNVYQASWEKAFAARSWTGWRYWNGKRLGWSGAWRPPPNEKQVMYALRRFCDRNGAFLAIKLRHSQEAAPWIGRVADKILGEESHYPHTSIELAAIAKVMFGFFTTGASETIAAGCPYVDLSIPGLREGLAPVLSASLKDSFGYPGAAGEMDARDWVARAETLTLADLRMEEKARRVYAERFCGPLDGRHSDRLVYAVEQAVRGTPPAAIPCDERGIVRLPA